MRTEIRIGGFGGQGVVSAGRVLSLTIMKADAENFVVYSPSYGFATRGGGAISDVIIDTERIYHPKILELDVFIALSQMAFDQSVSKVKKDGFIIADSTVNSGELENVLSMDIVRVASSVSSAVVSSIVALGAFVYCFPLLVSLEDLYEILAAFFNPKFETVNREAAGSGYDLAKDSNIATNRVKIQ